MPEPPTEAEAVSGAPSVRHDVVQVQVSTNKLITTGSSSKLAPEKRGIWVVVVRALNSDEKCAR